MRPMASAYSPAYTQQFALHPYVHPVVNSNRHGQKQAPSRKAWKKKLMRSRNSGENDADQADTYMHYACHDVLGMHKGQCSQI